MNWLTCVFLFLAGAAGGLINALAGGATLITFPSMLYTGLPPVIANASNAVAIMPGHLLAAIADRRRPPPLDRRMVMLITAAVLGGIAGAIILMLVPETAFTTPIPALIGFATLLFAFAPTIQAWASARPHLGFSNRATASTALGLASIYGGFFGAGLGSS